MLAKVATLSEIETHYSIDDVIEANEYLDLQDEAEKKQIERAKRRKGKR